MGNYINEQLLDASPYRKQKDEAKKLVSKWEKTGLLDGLNEDFKKSGMAVMLENQARQLIGEASKTSPAVGVAGGDYKGDEEWSGVALPLVRRIFGELAAQEFVSVQPMNLPSGLVFYLDFEHNKQRMNHSAGSSVQGKTGPFSPSGSNAPFGEEGFYGAGRYAYTAATGSTGVLDNPDAVAATWSDVNYDSEVSNSINKGKLWKVSVTSSFSTADKSSVRGWRLAQTGSYSAGLIKQVFNQFASVTNQDGVTGDYTVIVSASSAANASNALVVDFIKRTTEASRGDFEDTTADATKDSLQIPEIDLKLRSRPIVAKTRKLKAVWTPELAQDLNAYHSVDAEAELTSMLSEYISMEIDLEILDMLIADAITTDFWSLRQGNDYDATTSTFVNTTFTGTRFEWWQTLVAKIQKMSNEIHRLTLRGGANFVVCGPTIATVLESLPGYMSSTDGNKAQFAMGVQSIGAIQNRWTVYKNPYMSENTILVGFRGGNFLETGAVYAPYVPLIMTPLVYDPSDFTPRKGVMTRYAKKMIRPEFYGKIYVADLDLL